MSKPTYEELERIAEALSHVVTDVMVTCDEDLNYCGCALCEKVRAHLIENRYLADLDEVEL